MKPVFLALFLASAAAVAGFALYQKLFYAPTEVASEANADMAPDFQLQNLADETIKLSDLRGKLVLVNFWATWCAPCLKEIPVLVEVQNRFGARGLQIIGPAMDDPAVVRSSIPRLNIQYPVLLGEEQIPLVMDALGDTIGALPFSVLISPGGKILLRKHGEFELEELSELVEAHLPKT